MRDLPWISGLRIIIGFEPPIGLSGLTLLVASLITASKRRRGVKMSPAALKQLQQLRTETETKSTAQ